MPESGVENLVFHLKHHNLGTPKNCSIFGKPLDLCMILIILLIYFLIYYVDDVPKERDIEAPSPTI